MTSQVVSYSSGATATSALSSAGISQSGSNLIVTAPASFTVSDNSLPPNISIDIDVAGAVEVLTANGNVLPQPQV